MTKTPKVFVIVLAYNGRKWLEACLQSLLKTAYENFEIVVVDNKSTDDSGSFVKSNFARVTLIENNRNHGTAEGNNIGIRHALKHGADYVVVMNQDIRVDENWLAALVDASEQDVRIGALISMQYNYSGTEFDFNFNKILEQTPYYKDVQVNRLQSVYDVRYVIGASMLIRTDAIRKVGLFDPYYFMYEDDTDLCRRLRYRNYRVGISIQSIVYHNHTLTQKEYQQSTSKYLLKKNQLISMLKNPENSFFYNIKKTFRWTDWDKHFQKVKVSSLQIRCLYVLMLLTIPLLYKKYCLEKIAACYL